MEWVGSYVAVPLIIGGGVIGIINLNDETPGTFTQETLDRLQAFAAPAALAVHNARLYKAEIDRSSICRDLERHGAGSHPETKSGLCHQYPARPHS